MRFAPLGIAAAAVVLGGCVAPTSVEDDRLAEMQDDVTVSANRIAELEETVESLQRELDEVRSEVEDDTAAAPESAVEPTNPDDVEEPPSGEGGSVVFEGGDGNTSPQSIDAGDYAVTVETSGDCYFGLGLESTDGDSERLPAVEGNGTAESTIYGLASADWYVEAFTGPNCTYTVMLTPL